MVQLSIVDMAESFTVTLGVANRAALMVARRCKASAAQAHASILRLSIHARGRGSPPRPPYKFGGEMRGACMAGQPFPAHPLQFPHHYNSPGLLIATAYCHTRCPCVAPSCSIINQLAGHGRSLLVPRNASWKACRPKPE